MWWLFWSISAFLQLYKIEGIDRRVFSFCGTKSFMVSLLKTLPIGWLSQ